MLSRKLHNVAIVPARGNSKSIPRKNIIDLEGRPLIAYSIEAIRKSGLVDRIFVSTDNSDIAEAARKHGAETPFLRPAELAQDTTPTAPVIDHAVRWLEEKEAFLPDYILVVQPTSAFVKPEHIRAVFDLMREKGADSGISTVEVPRIFHPYHVRHVTSEGYLEYDNPAEHYSHPTRQSDPKRYAFGGIYWFSRESFMKEKKMEPGKRVGFAVDSPSAHDINDVFDLELARCLLKMKK